MKTHHVALAGLLALQASCSDDSGGSDGTKPSGQSISGLVTDLTQGPVEGAHVSAYGESTTTDAAGRFSFSADVPPDRVVVAFQKENFFDQTVGQKPSPDGSTNIRVALLPREPVGTVDNAAGGSVASGKMRGTFAPGSFVRADGSDIAGSVTVFAAYLDPDEPGFGSAMPGGDFSAEDSSGDDGILTSFGALAIEAEEEASGEGAQLKQDAELCLAIPASMLANAPDTMPVWRLALNSVWEQTGTAQRVGDEYCFAAKVLGFINCDIFSRSALLSGKVCDGSQSAPDTTVRVGQLSTQTDEKGEYAVLVQSGVPLTLETDFGTATVCPLTAGSSVVKDLCPATDDTCSDPPGGPWVDPATQLEWENPPIHQGPWAEAEAHCQALGDGWRLPTIRELRSLIRGCPSTQCMPTGGSCCGRQDSCTSDAACRAMEAEACPSCDDLAGPGQDGCYLPVELELAPYLSNSGGPPPEEGLKECGDYWSSSTGEHLQDNGDVTNHVYYVDFAAARVYERYPEDDATTRCVRAAM